ncbi:MAG: FtsW/RodA/SpoVE family cell cycle protein [Lachnospiraceae bacterium]|nr:FtsW/RodA/SpoVE family cell cycle protein [Lachnospiraceae bacterium]
METIITELSRYLIVILMALYTFWGFAAFSAKKKKKKARLYRKQRINMHIFLLLGHLILYLNTNDVIILGLYGCELVFFMISNFLYRKIYGKMNQPIVNHMQMLFSISFVMLARLNVDSAKKQFAYMAAGMVVCMILPWLLRHYHKLQEEGWFYAVLGLILLLVVLFFGKAKYGAKNWLYIGPLSIQPSEFVKVIFVFAFASILSQTKFTLKNVAKVSAMAAAFVLVLVLEKDLGAALIFFLCYLFMLYVATGKKRILAAGLGAGAAASFVGYHLFSHVRTRVLAWQNPWSDIDNKGYQIAQSLFAIGTGGWFGMGLMQGMPDRVPIRESDFIFAAISEELGAFFGICMILIYVSCFIWFASIAVKAANPFFKLSALGFTVIMMSQTFLTLGGVTKFIPSTGVTLPLVSYGGSSVLSVIVMMCSLQGIHLISDKEDEEIDEEQEELEEE